MKQPKQYVFDLIDDMVSDLLYYDRKEDIKFPIGTIEKMVEAGDITIDEMVDRFRLNLEHNL